MRNPFRGLRFSLLDFHNARANLGMKIAFAAICCIPLIYGGLYLAAFYDPYGNIDKVPVVVVNLDEGYEMDGETLEAGDAVVEQLKSADALDFTYDNDPESARAGLEAGTYYMELVIPEDFSECVASASTDEPRQAHFDLVANQSANSIATTMGLSAFRVITSRVNYAIGEDYYVSIFDMIDGSTAAIKVAADGSAELAEGLVDAENGSQQITDGLASAGDGAGTLAAGLVAASAGSQTLTDGLGTAQAGAATLDAGLGQLQSQGTSQVASGAAALQAQLDGQAAQIHQLSSGASQVSDGVDQVVGTMSGLSTTIAGAATQLADIQSQLDGINAAATGIEPLADKLTTDAQALAGDLTGLQSTLEGMTTSLKGVGTNVQNAGSGVQKAATQLRGIVSDDNLTEAQQAAITQALVALVGDDGGGGAGAELAAAGATLNAVAAGASSIDGATVTTHANAVADDLQTIGSSMGALTTQAQGVIDDSTNLMSGVAGTMAQLQSPQTQARLAALQAGASLVANGTATLDANLTTDAYDASGNPQTLHAGIAALSAGAATVDANLATAERGAAELSSGLSQLRAGSSTLSSGLGSAQTGAAALAQGLGLLYDGSETLTDGLGTAVGGAGELAEGLAEGYETADEATEGADARSEMMSEPVELDQSEYTTVTNYGSGFAPYFIALGLWVGAMMCTFIIKPLNRRLISSGARPLTAAFAGLVPSMLVGLIQAVLMAATLQFGLRIDLLHPVPYYLLCILTAICFAAWNQMLVAALGFPGKFVAIVLLMLQLTSAAGTFPIEVVPGFFQAINPLLPMTYAVRALRVATTGANLSAIGPDALMLVVFAAVPFAITCLVAARKRLVTLSDLHPLVEL